MTSLLLALVLLAVVATLAGRRIRRVRRRREAGRGPGSSPVDSIRVRTFDEIDAAIAARSCPCGGRYALAGEGTRETAGRRYRVSRLTCVACEEDRLMFFDTTELLQ